MPSPIDPTALARYGGLALVARGTVEGFLTGVHKSPYKGYSVEFAEHRQYYPGDEIRHLDWRVLAKTDRYFIKEYEEETNLKAYLLVDANGCRRGPTPSTCCGCCKPWSRPPPAARRVWPRSGTSWPATRSSAAGWWS